MVHSLLRGAGMHAQVAQVVQVTQVVQGQGRDTGENVFNVQLLLCMQINASQAI